MSSFYMTLPSNASLDVHPNNTLTEYTVELPRRIHLDGKYEVALHSLQYTRSWNNVNKGENRIRFSINQIIRMFEIEPGFYPREVDLVSQINQYISSMIEMDECHNQTLKNVTDVCDKNKFIYIYYEPNGRRVTLFQ